MSLCIILAPLTICQKVSTNIEMVVLKRTVFLLNFRCHGKSQQTNPAPRKFDQAFKAEALRMLDEGQSAVQVAKSLNVSDQLLHTWKHAHKKQTQKQVGTSELLAENERLKAQLKRAEMERDDIKKKHSDLHSTELKAMYRFIQDQSQHLSRAGALPDAGGQP